MKQHAPHVSQSLTSHPLLCSFHNLHSQDVRTEHLDPHLTSDFSQFIAQQEACIHAPRSNVQAYSRERIAGLKSNAKNVSNLDPLSILPVEKGFPFTSG